MFNSSADLIKIVLWDRNGAVSLMEHLSRYRSFMVEPDGHRWLVFARCGSRYSRAEVVGQIDAWATAHHRADVRVQSPPAADR